MGRPGTTVEMVNKVTAEDLEDRFAEDAGIQRKRNETCRKLEQFKQSLKLLEDSRKRHY